MTRRNFKGNYLLYFFLLNADFTVYITALPAMSVTVGSIIFVGQVTIISLFVICFHCNINNSHVFWYNRINFINFHYVFVAGESAVEAYSCILHMFFFFCSTKHLLPLLFLRRSLANSHFRQSYLFILSTVFTLFYLIILFLCVS